MSGCYREVLVSVTFTANTLEALEEQHGARYFDRSVETTAEILHHLGEAESLFRSLPDVVSPDSCPECGGTLWTPDPDPGWLRCRACDRLWSPDGRPWTPGVEG